MLTRACVALAAAFLVAVVPAPRQIDVAKSSAHFSVAHIWVERVTGTVPILSGSVVFDAGSVIPQSATAVLDATDLHTDDPDRDASLKSPDFFDVTKFPHWTFVSTRVVPKRADSFELDGTLTIHGVTQPEQLDVTVTGTPLNLEYRARATIDRHAFGMAKTRLDPTIGNTVSVSLDIVLSPG
ncbi:MAG TPA: YceI family protein [Candidatus Cybelea sp.]|nr:YceI family protein [Candidatus Cybelea sp.]